MRYGESYLVTANNMAKGEYWAYWPRDDESAVTMLVGGQSKEVARGSVLALDEALDAFERTIRARGAPFDDRWREL